MTEVQASALAVPEQAPGEASTPPPAPTRRQRMRAPLAAAGATLAGCALLLVADPRTPGHYPVCPTKLLTGVDCPFCGGLRCTRSLLEGNLGAAWDQNALVVVLAPVAVVLWVLWAWSRWTGRPIPGPRPGPRLSRVLLWGAIALMLAWTVYRNVPAGAFFASGTA